MDETATPPVGANIRQLLLALGEPVIDLVAAPVGLEDVEVGDVAILDADEEPEPYQAHLVLIIGTRGRRALRVARAAARHGAAAVFVKMDPDDDREALKELAEDTGTVVLGIRPEVRWAHLDSLVRGVIADARRAGEPESAEQPADLFALAETVSALTGGNISIEDATNRVLAYSRSDDGVDELRRRSILGWEGPAHYLALLREWGVFERLRAGGEVVRVEERADLGIRRRLAIGIRVQDQWLGSIWIQEGSAPLSDTAEQDLVGAARAAALLLVRHRTGTPSDLQVEEALLGRMLDGHIDPGTFATRIGAELTKPAAVVAFALPDIARSDPAPTKRRPTGSAPMAPASTDDGASADRPAFELRRAEMASLVTVHAGAFRRRALVAAGGSRVYMLLPGLPEGTGEGMVAGLAGDIVRSAEQRLHLDVRAAVGSVVDGLDSIAASKADADRVLGIIARQGDRRVATIADVRSEVLVTETLALLEQHPRLRDPRITVLLAYDHEHESGLVPSVLAYLAAQCNMRAAARLLHLHTNTLRYRLKRAETISGIDLADPHQCLFTHLQLLLETGPAPLRGAAHTSSYRH
ncbi:PucR family transcriptional regulator [Streptomyces canus]|uniref:PucR family transcriptional regulator n=1 Tax=Streptomyces canus TaxID=58343 RepID=UPI002259DE26|nr:helix-turn-helix domain-containing protein [Streptomyces canus]MCX4857541.1 helix-turn-helix domain-containing protein [Streptomyces canus]